MHERTSAHHYNPQNWDKLENSFQWIDEPTNTFTFSLKKKNVFYLTIFHPSILKVLSILNLKLMERLITNSMKSRKKPQTSLHQFQKAVTCFS